MTTVGEAISRVRNVLKAVKEDPFLTDRTIMVSVRILYSEVILLLSLHLTFFIQINP
jgi:hypothetical protein